jgi:hypothetical protein
MRTSLTEKLNRAIRRITGTESCPEIRWEEVVRIEALGTDALGPFEITVTFVYANGSETNLFVHHQGYGEIVSLLPRRYPSIPPHWQEEMARESWHVERVLYSRLG